LKAIGEDGNHPALFVHLQSIASDEKAALANVRGRAHPDALGERSPAELALEALEKAKAALDDTFITADDQQEKTGAGPNGDVDALGRILRKQAFLEILLRNLSKAHGFTLAAAECLAERPLHPEQPRLRLALGKIYLLQGHFNKGVKALE
jgi:hypothetical protein